jgi:hypothetical protein
MTRSYRPIRTGAASQGWRRTAALVLVIMFVVMPVVVALANGILG